MRVLSLTFLSVFLYICATPVHARLTSFAPVAERVLPAVVNISTTQTVQTGGGFRFGAPGNVPELQDERREELEKFFERFGLPFAFPPQGTPAPQREVQSLGSGFVIDPQGYVVTNNHVVAEASEIVVIFSDDTKLIWKLGCNACGGLGYGNWQSFWTWWNCNIRHYFCAFT